MTQPEESRNNDKAPGGNGEVEGSHRRALDSMDKLNRERIVFKGKASL